MPFPRFLVDAALTVIPKLMGGALTLGMSLALIGSFGPSDYGRYTFSVTLIVLADAVIGTPFDLAVIRLVQASIAADPGRALAAERIALWLKLAVTGAVAALVAVAVGRSAGDLMPLVALAALGAMVLRSALLHLQLRQRFRAYGGIELAHVLFRNTPILALILWEVATPERVLACLAAGPALAAVTAWLLIRRRLAAEAPGPSAGMGAAGMGAAGMGAGTVGRLVMWYVPTLALGATLAQLDILMLGVMRPGDALGHYGAAAVAASVPGMLGMYLGVVLTPRVVSAAAAGTLRRLFLRIQAGLTVAAIGLGLAAAALLGSPLTARLPADYALSLPVFATLLPGMLVAMTTSAMALPLVLVTRKRFLLRLDMMVAPLAALSYWGAITAWSVLGAASVTLAVTLFRSLAVLAAAWRITATPAELD